MSVLDAIGPPAGPCGLCGHPDARHRVADAIVDRSWAGETVEALAADYDVSVESIERVVRGWEPVKT